MRKLLFILLLPAFLFTVGCQKDPINPDPNPNPDPGSYKITWNVSTEFSGDLTPFDKHIFSMNVYVREENGQELLKSFGENHDVNSSFTVTLTGDSARMFLAHDSLQVEYFVELCGFNGLYEQCYIVDTQEHQGSFSMPVKKENDWHFVFVVRE